MSDVTEQQGLGNNQANFKYDFSKIFIRNNIYRTINIEASGADVELTPGVLIGTIAASGKGAIMKSGAGDGSELPTGVCAEEITIADGENADINICIGGEIAEEKLIFDGSDDLDTSVDDRIYRDRIASDTAGIILRATTDLGAYDNE